MPTRPAPRLTGVLETSLYVADLDRSAAFYMEVIGCESFLRDDRMCALGVAPGQVLLLFRQGGSAEATATPGGVIPPHDGRGQLHLCFSAPASELGAWQAHLDAHGIAIESDVAWPHGGRSIYFRDPDGHALEIAIPGLWPNY
jgi:catechol 2,3-dioxygenase-like lactoylglutathione lyase family enzyme